MFFVRNLMVTLTDLEDTTCKGCSDSTVIRPELVAPMMCAATQRMAVAHEADLKVLKSQLEAALKEVSEELAGRERNVGSRDRET